MELLQLAAPGASLALRVYEPEGEPLASVVIGAAMGVPQSFYQAFAEWLAGQGFRVTSFDYRGHGDSLQGSMRKVRADLLDWARDYEAVVQDARNRLPRKPLFLLGHSLGAQLPGLFQQPRLVDGLLSIASGSGYWRDNAPKVRRSMPFFWHVLVPVITRVCGYFPGRRLNMVGDLPAGVMLQWRRWCLHPRYSLAEGREAEARYAAASYPLLALSMDDDELMTRRGIEQLAGFYTNAPSRVEHLQPADLGLRRIGHFGFFRPEMREPLWSRAAEVLGNWSRGAMQPVWPAGKPAAESPV
ncbi:alpha/beta hydrolase family protein [Comamonas composti]|uniref:alpha/beta hydrolase family protein n=1 Tax=Comamonas composti TaxID=408558 RepID=UPI00041701A4|nr:alpha/beta fold hydrolase [Comamonas composti]